MEAILTDSIGALAPRLMLCRRRTITTNETVGWFIDGTAQQIPRGCWEWGTLEEAREDLRAKGFEVAEKPCTAGGDYEVIHPPTLAEAERRERAATEKWADAEPCFLRYGDLPAGGRSRNHADGSMEAGVSVYRGEILPSGEARVLPTTTAEFCGLQSIANRPLYLVEGEEIGVGSDGEPLLRNCRIVRRIK